MRAPIPRGTINKVDLIFLVTVIVLTALGMNGVVSLLTNILSAPICSNWNGPLDCPTEN